MANYVFGGGTFKIGSGGSAVTVGTMQEFGLDIDGDVIELFGSKQFAVDVASGKKKVSVKFKAGEVQFDALGAMIGSTVTSGVLSIDNTEMGSVTPFQVSWEVTYLGQKYTATLLACVFKKWSMSGGNDKHALVDGEVSCFADASDHVCTLEKASA